MIMVSLALNQANHKHHPKYHDLH